MSEKFNRFMTEVKDAAQDSTVAHAASRKLNRRDFLKLAGAALVGTLAACTPTPVRDALNPTQFPTNEPSPTPKPTEAQTIPTEVPSPLKPGRGGELTLEQKAFVESEIGIQQMRWINEWYKWLAISDVPAFSPDLPGSENAHSWIRPFVDPTNPASGLLVIESTDYPGVVIAPNPDTWNELLTPTEFAHKSNIQGFDPAIGHPNVEGMGLFMMSPSSKVEGIPEGSALAFINDNFVYVDQSGKIVGQLNRETKQWEATAAPESTRYTVQERLQMLKEGTLIGDNGKVTELSVVFDKFADVYSTPEEIEKINPDSDVIIFESDGKITVWSNVEEAKQIKDVIIITPTTGTNIKINTLALAMLRVAGEQYQKGNESVYVTFGRISKAPFVSTISIDLDDRLYTTEANGKKVCPFLHLPPTTKVIYGNESGYSSPTTEMMDPEGWYQAMIDAGVTKILIFPQYK